MKVLPFLAATGDHSVAPELGNCENMILEEKRKQMLGKGRKQVKRRRERIKKKTEYRERTIR